MHGFFAQGWKRFAYDRATHDWARQARQVGQQALVDPRFAQWHVCQGTWFVGVDALECDAQGRVGASEPLSGPALAFISAHLGGLPPLDKGQYSVVRPGYPQPREGESLPAFRYRQNRDGAHLDGIKPIGPQRRRMIDEPHAFILGLPLNETDPGHAPLVVWEGSHVIMADALRTALGTHDPANWGQIDVTEAYGQARQTVFETCKRVVVHGAPGEAYLLHRLALHGVAPWPATPSDQKTREIAYFRPPMPGGAQHWLEMDKTTPPRP